MMLTRAEFQRASLDFQRTSLELQNKIEKQFSEIMAALNRSRDDELCDDRSPLDRYSPSSQKVKESGFDHFERSGVDRRFGGGQFHEGDRQTYGSSAELLDLRFREYLMLRSDDDDETDWWYRSEEENPEEQALDDGELVETEVVTESDGIEQQTVNNEENANENLDILEEESIAQIQVPVSSLESSLQFHNASSDICDDFKSSLFGHQEAMLQVSHVKVRDEMLTKSTDVTNNQAAHYQFDKMPLRMQSKRRHIKCHKSWRFKFKHRVASRESKAGFEVNMKHNRSKEMLLQLLLSGTHKKRQRKTPKYHKTWKFRFKNIELQRIMTQLDTQHFIFRWDKQPLLWVRNNAEPILIDSEFEKKKQMIGYKTRMFKYKAPLRRRQFLHHFDKEVPIETNWAVQGIWDKDSPDVGITDAYYVLQEEFEQVENHTPSFVVKLERPQDHDALLLPFHGDERFQIKHKWRFKLLPLISEWEFYSDRLVLITNYAQQLDISRLMILMSVGWFTNLRSQLLFTALKWSIHSMFSCKSYSFLLYKTLRSRFLQRREICYRKTDMGRARWAAPEVQDGPSWN